MEEEMCHPHLRERKREREREREREERTVEGGGYKTRVSYGEWNKRRVTLCKNAVEVNICFFLKTFKAATVRI